MNYEGLECHPTDEYVHWTERDRKGLMLKLRPAYDKIVSMDLKKELTILLEAAYDSGRSDEADCNNPDI